MVILALTAVNQRIVEKCAYSYFKPAEVRSNIFKKAMKVTFSKC